MNDRHAALLENLLRAALETPGSLPVEQRRAAFANASTGPETAYVKLIHGESQRISDEMVQELKRHYTDEQIFELTIAAAVAAAKTRLDSVLPHIFAKE